MSDNNQMQALKFSLYLLLILSTLRAGQSDASSFFSPLRWAPVFVLGMSACRYVTVLYASLPFMVELNPRMWNVPLPKVEFLPEDLWSKWREKALGRLTEWNTSFLVGLTCILSRPLGMPLKSVGPLKWSPYNTEDQIKWKYICSWLLRLYKHICQHHQPNGMLPIWHPVALWASHSSQHKCTIIIYVNSQTIQKLSSSVLTHSTPIPLVSITVQVVAYMVCYLKKITWQSTAHQQLHL